MVHHFVSTLQDADVTIVGLEKQENLPDYPEWSKVEDCTIKWQAEPEILDNGIGSLNLLVTRASCVIYYTYLLDEAPQSDTIRFDTMDEKWKGFKFVIDLTADPHSGVTIRGAELNFKDKTVTVS